MTRKCPRLVPFGPYLVVLATLLLLLGGCATIPPPTGLMDQASMAMDSARAEGAGDYAPLELGSAARKLDLAQAAMAQGDYELAAQLAEESQSNSTLAKVKAQLATVRDKIRSQSAENTRLRSGLDNADTLLDDNRGGGV